MTIETKQVEALFGPYTGSILTMTANDADAAVAEKWALDPPRTPPIDPAAPPLPTLTAEERQAAEDAANDWAAEQRGEKTGPGEGEISPAAAPNKAMKPAPSSRRSGYETR